MKRREHLPRGVRAEPRPEPAQAATAGVQKLQQAAGNRAVAGLIQRQRSAATGCSKAASRSIPSWRR